VSCGECSGRPSKRSHAFITTKTLRPAALGAGLARHLPWSPPSWRLVAAARRRRIRHPSPIPRRHRRRHRRHGFALVPARQGLAIGGASRLLALAPPGAVTWSSSDAGVASVDAQGQVTALAEGSAVITATSGACDTSSAVKVFRARPRTAARSSPRHWRRTGSAPSRFDVTRCLRSSVTSACRPSSRARRARCRTTICCDSWRRTIGALSRQRKTCCGLSWCRLSMPRAGTRSGSPDGTARNPSGRGPQGPAGDRPDQLQGEPVTPRSTRMSRPITSHLLPGRPEHGQRHHRSRGPAGIAVGGRLRRRHGLAQALSARRQPGGCSGGDSKVDIYYVPGPLFGLAAWTNSYPLAAAEIGVKNACALRPSYIMLNPMSNEFLSAASQPENARLMVKSLLAHEFLHVLQFAMDRQTVATTPIGSTRPRPNGRWTTWCRAFLKASRVSSAWNRASTRWPTTTRRAAPYWPSICIPITWCRSRSRVLSPNSTATRLSVLPIRGANADTRQDPADLRRDGRRQEQCRGGRCRRRHEGHLAGIRQDAGIGVTDKVLDYWTVKTNTASAWPMSLPRCGARRRFS